MANDFYPRPPRGGRPRCQRIHDCRQCISIHALRAEGDLRGHPDGSRSRNFYPRPPRGGRHYVAVLLVQFHAISIHALREEGDARFCKGRRRLSYFYPRPPRGGRRAFLGRSPRANRFLSTPSARRATRPVQGCARQAGISIHALREEGDPSQISAARLPVNFYPRPPRGGRLSPRRGETGPR